jgi:hypothetical protein
MSEETRTISIEQTTQDSNGAVSEAPQSPFCRELRSKRYYFRQEMATEPHHLLDGSNRCWCRLTMQAIGPDREMVHPRDCTPSRACYKSTFETS